MANSVRVVPVQIAKKNSLDEFGDKIVNLLDDVERRVETLREDASQLEIEKESILDLLNTVTMNTDMLRLGFGDRADIGATMSRLEERCKTVQVVVNTPRNSEQTKALEHVNSQIEDLIQKMQDDIERSKHTCKGFLNACNPDQPDGPIDFGFQSQVIDCTADDQKKIRRRLTQVVAQIDRAQRTAKPTSF